ncbi:glycosyltransferase [Corynebacterium casei]|uniref:glycosyltransferase n=1 Tax=Corynebacterium casei TaxID=160386 RepID=UPI003FCF2567
MSSQKLKNVPGLRRLGGSRAGRALSDFMLGKFGVKAVLQATVTTQRSARTSTAEVVLVSSNGAGLGHLTRLESISRKLKGSSLIYTLSKGYKRLGKNADKLMYFPSARTLDLNSRTWNSLLFSHFGSVVSTVNPKVVVFDGTYLYPGIVDVCKALDIPLVWIRRGRWKKSVRENSKQYNFPSQYCDLVVIPGEYEENIIVKSSFVLPVSPVTVFSSEELRTKNDALDAFALVPDRKYVLVQLGAGTINEIDDWNSAACEAILGLGEEWTPVLLSNPLKEPSNIPERALLIEAFPVSLYLKAFEFVIVAAGYNSVQEAVAFEIPFISVPNFATATDDQDARARAVHDAGLGVRATNLDELTDGIKVLAVEKTRSKMKDLQRKQVRPNGADEIAQILQERFLT